MVYVDLIGLWNVKFEIERTDYIVTKKVKAITAVNKATGWPEVIAMNNTR